MVPGKCGCSVLVGVAERSMFLYQAQEAAGVALRIHGGVRRV